MKLTSSQYRAHAAQCLRECIAADIEWPLPPRAGRLVYDPALKRTAYTGLSGGRGNGGGSFENSSSSTDTTE